MAVNANVAAALASDAGWYRRSPVDGKQLRACTRRAISLSQNKGIPRRQLFAFFTLLPLLEKYKRTSPNDFTEICIALVFFFSLYIFTFRKAIFVRRSRYETREIGLVLPQLRENSSWSTAYCVKLGRVIASHYSVFYYKRLNIFYLAIMFTHMKFFFNFTLYPACRA